MRSTKRVLLADGSRLFKEMLQRVIAKTDHLEVVEEMPDREHLSSSIERHGPEWVIVTEPYSPGAHSWIGHCLADYPSVRFMFLAPSQNQITMKWQTAHEEYSELSLKQLIYILKEDLQHT